MGKGLMPEYPVAVAQGAPLLVVPRDLSIHTSVDAAYETKALYHSKE